MKAIYFSIITLVAIIWIGGCKTTSGTAAATVPVDDTVTANHARKISRNKELYNAIKETVPVDTAWLVTDTLHILTGKIIGCDDNSFQLFWNGAMMKSLPPQVTVRLYQEVDGACAEKHRFHLLYNVKSLKITADTTSAATDSLLSRATILHIGGYKNAVKYSY